MRATKGKPLNGHNLYLMFSVFCMIGTPDVRQPMINLLKPNDTHIYIYIYICRSAVLTSSHYILNIYSTNIHTEYFKHAA